MHSDRKYLATVLSAAVAAGAALSLSACMTQSQSAPPLAGPSGFGLVLTMTASPDIVQRDGSSQSTVRLNFRDGSSNSALGQRRVIVNTTAGTLSVGEVVTDTNGNAALTFTAPSLNTPVSSAQITAVPVGENLDNARTQLVTIALLGPDVPTASFTIAPNPPAVGQDVTFDASASSLTGAACGSNCSYSWNFGDGSNGSGVIVQHAFTMSGVQNVTLTVSAPGGTSSSKTTSFVIGAPAAPKALFVVTPATPTAGQQAIFNATTSTVGAGATIVQYIWDFGDGTTATTGVPIHAKTYATPGTYIMSLTVVDSMGRTASTPTTVTVN
jgi:PKD repeat protein